jgi:hypothetical protein
MVLPSILELTMGTWTQEDHPHSFEADMTICDSEVDESSQIQAVRSCSENFYPLLLEAIDKTESTLINWIYFARKIPNAPRLHIHMNCLVSPTPSPLVELVQVFRDRPVGEPRISTVPLIDIGIPWLLVNTEDNPFHYEITTDIKILSGLDSSVSSFFNDSGLVISKGLIDSFRNISGLTSRTKFEFTISPATMCRGGHH